MNSPEAIFKVIEDNECPLYKVGDIFKLVGKALFLDYKSEKTFITTAVINVPEKSEPCRILVADITSILIEYGGLDKVPKYVTNCSGCSGTIRISYRNSKSAPEPEKKAQQPPTKADKYTVKIAALLSNFSIFKSIREDKIRKLVPLLRLVKVKQGEFVIKQGDPGRNLYIIVSGKVEVLGDENMNIAYLGKGEVFGEMSLLSGNPVGASVQVLEPAMILFINAKNFRRVMDQYPSLQMYFTRLLARRLAKTNVERAEELSSGMIGKLSEIAPSELFQTLNVNQKTGVLNMRLAKGPAFLAFREGHLVRAEYGKSVGKEAFYDMLKEKDGRFKFVPGLKGGDLKADEIGDFMWLLMEGLNRIDEEADENA